MPEETRSEDVPHLAGTLVTEHLRLFEERFGKAPVERALARLRAADRDELVHARPASWVRLGAVEAVYAVLAAELGRDVADVHREIGQMALERALKTLWRVMMHFTSDAALIARAPMIFGRSYDRGRLTAELVAPRRAMLTITGWPNIPDFPIRSVSNGITAVLGMAGRSDVRVTISERRPDGIVLEGRWRS